MSAGEGAPQTACAMPMAIIVDDRLDVSSPTLLRRAQILHTHVTIPYKRRILRRILRLLYCCAQL